MHDRYSLARDRGCTRPGCAVAGANCQVHHAVADWADHGQTNIDDLFLACPKENRMVKPGGWTTRKRQDLLRLRGITAGDGGLGVPVGRFAPALPRHAGGLPPA
jgi:hypothetical protein